MPETTEALNTTGTATATAAPGEPPVLDLTAWTCPAPLRDQPRVVMGHGGGGALSAELVQHVFAPGYGGDVLAQLTDSAVVSLGGARLAFSTDSYVVRPLFFPGGSIGDLAVNGTVNDLAMSGARAAYLSCGFILEEGVEVSVVARVANALGAAARAAGVEVATGDTKVVDAGHGDGIFINTAGIGLVPAGVDLRPQRVVAGDVVIVSGAIGMHGVAIMSVREGLEFGVEIESDCAPLGGLVETMLAVTPDLHVLRDPTRGGWPRRSTRSRRPPAPVSSSRNATSRSRRPWPTPAPSWAWTRCTWPTKENSSRSSPGSTPKPFWRRCGRIRWERRRSSSARRWRRIQAWSSPAPGSAGRAWSTCRSGSSCPGSAEPSPAGAARGSDAGTCVAPGGATRMAMPDSR